MQKLEVVNFGPVKYIGHDFEVRNFMLFVGPQASGKSTIAKIIFFFKSLKEDLMNYLIGLLDGGSYKQPLDDYTKIIRHKFINYFGFSFRPKEQDGIAAFYYAHGFSISIHLDAQKGHVSPILSPSFEAGFRQLVDQSTQFIQSLNRGKDILSSKEILALENDKRRFIKALQHQCNELFQEDRELLFIPAGRSLLATLADQIQLINPHKLDYLMRSFVDKINLLRPIFGKSLEELVQEREILNQEPTNLALAQIAQNIIERILKGKYQYDRQGEKIYFREDKYIKLNFASSGQQESLWILLLLFLAVLEQQNLFVVIEEPEAHLFPEAQKEIAALIALAANLPSAQVVVTTHSPYILAAFNNLILAHRVGQRYPEAVRPRIEEAIWLNIENTQAYFVEQGQMHSIVDPELQLIQQETIDTISQTINAEFDFLFDLDLS